MTGEPILGKNDPMPGMDNKLFTWRRLLVLRAWAQEVADAEGGSVYLVGSTLKKTHPRDIDVSIVLPHDEYVRRYGPIPEPGTPEMNRHMGVTGTSIRLHQFEGFRRLGYYTHFDLKICPDSWWPEKDKLLLASPRNQVDSYEQE